MTITKGLINLGMEFCADVESLAPRTRGANPRAVDLTPSSLTVRAERLRSLLARTAVPGTDAQTGEIVDESIERILEILSEWRARSAPIATNVAEAERVTRERGALFLSLHRRQRSDAARAKQSPST
jgi:hypothetical protein